MAEPAAHYVSKDLARHFRSQAYKIWGVTAAIVLVWVAAIVLPAVLPGAGGAVYSFFGYICHQMPERSMHIGGNPLAVCSRCFGVYFGLLAGLAAYPLFRRVDEIEPLPRIWLFLSLVPIGIDWSLTVFGIWENTHLSRFATGAILGAACAVYIVPAAVEIGRNMSLKRRAAA